LEFALDPMAALTGSPTQILLAAAPEFPPSGVSSPLPPPQLARKTTSDVAASERMRGARDRRSSVTAIGVLRRADIGKKTRRQPPR
jgi:hypothetical protein